MSETDMLGATLFDTLGYYAKFGAQLQNTRTLCAVSKYM